MNNQTYLENFLKKYGLSAYRLAKLTTYSNQLLGKYLNGSREIPDRLVVLLKYMGKVYELTGEFL